MSALIGAAFAACMTQAAAVYDLPEAILWSIAQQEAGAVGTMSINKNRTLDLGIMQINSVNIPELTRHYRGQVAPEALAQRLAHDGCFNIKMAAWILKRRILEAGDFWTGVGHYHSRTPHLARAYIGKVSAHAKRVFGEAVFAAKTVPRP